MQRLATISRAIVAIATVGTLLISVWEINNTLKNEEIHKWQKTIVFSIISGNQTEAGISSKRFKPTILLVFNNLWSLKYQERKFRNWL